MQEYYAESDLWDHSNNCISGLAFSGADVVDFGLEDRLCDAAQLNHSWDTTRIPDAWLSLFLFALNNISKSAFAKVNDTQIVTNEAIEDDEDDNED